jgi:VanZ family protein
MKLTFVEHVKERIIEHSLFAWLSILLMLSLIPLPETGIDPEWHLDKVVHFLLYGITAILFYRRIRLRLRLWHILFSIGLASLYGFFLEVLQRLVSWRSFSLSDITANVLGATTFVLIYIYRLKGDT